MVSHILVLFFHFRREWGGGGGCKCQAKFTSQMGISTVSPVRRGALQLHQVISPCERCCWLSCIPTTRGYLVQDGPRGKIHRNTVQLFSGLHSTVQQEKSSTTCKLLMHAIYMHSFQYSKSKEFSIVYKVATSSITSCKQQHKFQYNTSTFEQETSSIMRCKQQHPNLKNSSIFKQDACLNRPKLTCITNIVFMH